MHIHIGILLRHLGCTHDVETTEYRERNYVTEDYVPLAMIAAPALYIDQECQPTLPFGLSFELHRLDVCGDLQLLCRDGVAHVNGHERIAEDLVDLFQTLVYGLRHEEPHANGSGEVHHEEKYVVSP